MGRSYWQLLVCYSATLAYMCLPSFAIRSEINRIIKIAASSVQTHPQEQPARYLECDEVFNDSLVEEAYGARIGLSIVNTFRDGQVFQVSIFTEDGQAPGSYIMKTDNKGESLVWKALQDAGVRHLVPLKARGCRDSTDVPLFLSTFVDGAYPVNTSLPDDFAASEKFDNLLQQTAQYVLDTVVVAGLFSYDVMTAGSHNCLVKESSGDIYFYDFDVGIIDLRTKAQDQRDFWVAHFLGRTLFPFDLDQSKCDARAGLLMAELSKIDLPDEAAAERAALLQEGLARRVKNDLKLTFEA